MKPEPEQRRDGTAQRRAAVLVLLALMVGAFLPVFGAGFINLDDPRYVADNAQVRRGWSRESAWWALTAFDAANWHPLTWASHLSDVSLFGLRPAAHHAMSLALHALAAGLLLLGLAAMTGRLRPSLAAAGFFALHPLRVESVAWIAERKDVLAGMLAAATLALYLRHVRQPAPRRLLPVVVVFALGLMAKPTLVTLPLLLLLLDWWPLGRFEPAESGKTTARAAAVSRAVLEKVPLLAAAAVSGLLSYLAQRQWGAVAPFEIFPLPSRLLNALSSYAGYLANVLWPAGLMPFYPHRGKELTITTALPAFVLLIGAGTAAWALRRRHPWLLCGWLWYVVALVPMIGIVQVGLQGMADRYTYLPSIGLALALAWEVFPHPAAGARAGAARGAAIAAVLAVLLLLTARQAAFWKDTDTLFTRATQIDPANYLAYNQLGAEALARGEGARALSLLSRAFAARPEYLVSRYNLGLALSANGRHTEALPHISAYLRVIPRDASARLARAMVLGELDRHAAALQDVEVALEIRPENPKGHFLRGYSLGELGRVAAAVDAYRRAAALDPGGAAIRFNLAQALRRLGRTREALVEFEAAVRLNPRDAEALNALGATLVEQGRLEPALPLLEEAVRLSPDFVAARANLVRLRAALAARPPAPAGGGR